MDNADSVAAKLVEASGVIDEMEASTGVFGAADKVFLAHYQIILASGPTSLSDDATFTQMFSRYMDAKSRVKSRLGSG